MFECAGRVSEWHHVTDGLRGLSELGGLWRGNQNNTPDGLVSISPDL